MEFIISTQCHFCIGINWRPLLNDLSEQAPFHHLIPTHADIYRHSVHSSHTNCILLPRYLHLSTLCPFSFLLPSTLSLPLSPPTALQMFGSSTPFPSPSHSPCFAVNSTGGPYAATLPVILVFPTLLLQGASRFVIYNLNASRVLLIQDRFTHVSGGRPGRTEEISNKVERAIEKGEMLLNLIRIRWSVDFGCSSAEQGN